VRSSAQGQKDQNLNLTDRLLLRLVPPLGAGFIRVVARTMRLERIDEPDWEREFPENEGVIFAFWHNRLFLMPYARRRRKVAVLISRHRDGELVSRTMKSFGFDSVRGSTTRGGRSALRRLPDVLRDGYDVGITPDGPKGPRYRVQPGAVQLARLSGRPVIPIAFASSRPRRFSSWDRFQVPRPFTKGVFIWGSPLWVSRKDDIEEKRMELERSMILLTGRAEELVGLPAEEGSDGGSGGAA
jgi:lysophospholipid acyltransferase (LPLAT)-like uncharacterized protein